jgi:uncharacterized RDD family membrane protein YckC
MTNQPPYDPNQPPYDPNQPPYDPNQPGYGQPYPPQGYWQQPAPGYGVLPNYANWGLRVSSYLIDSLMASVPYFVLIVVGAATGDETVATALFIVGALASIGLWVWNLVRQGRTGQTVGKSAVGTFLMRETTGSPVGPGLSIGRSLLHFVDGLPCYLGYLWPLWDSKMQTFSDKICGTIVARR